MYKHKYEYMYVYAWIHITTNLTYILKTFLLSTSSRHRYWNYLSTDIHLYVCIHTFTPLYINTGSPLLPPLCVFLYIYGLMYMYIYTYTFIPLCRNIGSWLLLPLCADVSTFSSLKRFWTDFEFTLTFGNFLVM
jgi:hypothetical protein